MTGRALGWVVGVLLAALLVGTYEDNRKIFHAERLDRLLNKERGRIRAH